MKDQVYISVAGLTVELNYLHREILRLCGDYVINKPETVDIVAVSTEEKIQREINRAQEPVSPVNGEECCLFRDVAEQAPLLGRFLMHGAAISYAGKGYLFTALSGTGKTTHISLWKKYLGDEVDIINGDKPLIHVSEEEVSVCATPWAGKERWHRNCAYPLGGICLISRGVGNRIRRIEPREYLNLLLQQIYMPANPAALTATLDLVDRMLARVPVYLLECDMSEEAVKTSFRAVTGLEYRRSEKEGTKEWDAVKRPKNEKPMQVIANQTFDEERALYGSHDLEIVDCTFDGPADGESALKECGNIRVRGCYFNLRYPFWHVENLGIIDSQLTEGCRAALWYSKRVSIQNTKLHGIKALRECERVLILDSDILSPEFGWSVNGMIMRDSTAVSEYFMLRSNNLQFHNVKFKGKYSFQYIRDSVFENCVFDTKDAFWHGENVTVRNSVLKGEYLAWYSNGLTLENCKIVGTQPLCYCRNLRLINCEMIDTDLSFEKSEVEATLTAPIVSIKNPLSGRISVPAVGEIIRDDPTCTGEILVR